jgi:concanavalin A-like lectin/glucanase superfamily protein
VAVRFSADGQDYTRTLSLGSQAAYTIALWVKISIDRNDVSTVWCVDNGSDQAGVLQTDSDGTSLLYFDHTENVHSVATLTAGVWHYVAISVNGANGTAVSRAATASTYTVSTWNDGATSLTMTNLRLGESVFGSQWLNGCVTGVRLWQATLTQAELENEAWTYLPRRTANLTAWYPQVRTETVDYSGNGRTLSGGSGAATEDGPPVAWRQGRRRVHTPLSIPAEATPDTILAPWSVPAPAISTGATATVDTIAAPWSVPAPEIYTGEPVTPVDADLISAPWSMFAPTVDAFKNVNVAAPLIAAGWSIPTPAVTVPVNPGDDLDAPGQLSYNGFKLGGGTRYRWLNLEGAGVDLPGVDNGNVPHPSAHGSISGRKLSQARIVTFTSAITAPRDEMEEAALAFLNGLPLPEADEELPLAIRVLDTIYVCYGAVIRRAAPVQKTYRLGRTDAVVQWEMSDPRLYSRALRSATVPDGGSVDVFNAGNAKTRPLVRVPGPAHGPMLTAERILGDGTSDLRVIEFDLEVGEDETLIIDPTIGTATIGGVSKVQYLTGASVGIPDWVLGRAATTIAYDTQEGDAPSAVVLWRDAWI